MLGRLLELPLTMEGIMREKHIANQGILFLLSFSIIFLLATSFNVFASNNRILSGKPFSYTGFVVEYISGGGCVLATETENIKIFGLGPSNYWEHLNIILPEIGDPIKIDGYSVDFNGVQKNIAISLSHQ